MVAIGHSILVIAYHILIRRESYHDLDPNYFDEQDRQHEEQCLVRRLKTLGYEVELKRFRQGCVTRYFQSSSPKIRQELLTQLEALDLAGRGLGHLGNKLTQRGRL